MSGSQVVSKRARVLPGFGLSLGYTIVYLSLIVLIPLSAVFIKSAQLDVARLRRHRHRTARHGKLPAHVRRVACGSPRQLRLRAARRMGARALSFSGKPPGGRAGRPAVRPAYCGGRHCADGALHGQRLDRFAADADGHQGRLHAARRDGRADLHRPALRRAHRAAGLGTVAARARGGRGHARARHAGTVSAVWCFRSCFRRW